MTDQEINIAIAEACGWKRSEKYDYSLYGRVPHGYLNAVERVSAYEKDDVICRVERLPNYCNDLNAMQEAEMALLNKGTSFTDYCTELETVAHDRPSAMCATARQRAEAFLRVKGLWREQ